MMASAQVLNDYDEKKETHSASSDPETMKGTIGLEGPLNTTQGEDTTLAILELVKAKDAHHPIHWPAWKRWSICTLYCFLQLFVTLTSTTYVSAEFPINDKFGGNYSSQVMTLGQSLFILGNAVGPAFMGPLSDIGGRKWVYVASITAYAILNFVSLLCCLCTDENTNTS